jgi:signal transduction histidine kinase
MKPKKLLKKLIWYSWVGPAIVAIATSTLVFVLFGWLDHQRNINTVVAKASESMEIITRRLAAEINIADQGAAEEILQVASNKFQLTSVAITGSMPCIVIAPEITCSRTENGHFNLYAPIPLISESKYLVAEVPMPDLANSLNPRYLIWSIAPIIGILIAGIYTQRRILRRYVLAPIEMLAASGGQDVEVSADWPDEIKILATGLNQSLRSREQATFAVMVTGIIHDVRTYLHSLLIAHDLVARSPVSDTQRNERLEQLQDACAVQLPKIQRILDLSLDSYREIPIRKINANVAETIRGAIQANRGYATERLTTISDVNVQNAQIFPHDPIQLERALTNLIKNGIDAASKFSPDQSVRSVAVKLTKQSNSCFKITIEDSGPGLNNLSPDMNSPQKSMKAHGAGLGLFIAKKIIDGHGGKIGTESTSSLGGAIFAVTLPTMEVTI